MVKQRIAVFLRTLTGMLGAGIGGWMMVMLAETWLVRGQAMTLAATGAAAALAALAALAGAPLLLAIQGLVAYAARGGARRQALVLLALWALALVPSFDQARFLTAGDGIAASGWASPLRVVFTLAISAALVALALWHARATLALSTKGPVALVFRVPRSAALVVGALAAPGLFYAVALKLQFYQYFAAFLSVPLWVLVTTLALASLPGARARAVVGAALLLSAATASLAPVEPRRATRCRTASLTQLVLGIRRPDAATVLDVSDPGRFRCDPPTTRPKAASPIARVRNVVLISIDALRADVLDRAHAGKPVTPSLRAFRDESIAFDNAQVPYPATLFSLAGALTGLGPSEILFAPDPPPTVFRLTRAELPRQLVVLPKSAWFKMPVIDALIVQGTPTSRHASADAETRQLIERLTAAKKSGEATLAWIHYFEPHAPYETHAGHSFGRGQEAKYLSEVSFVDRQLGKLLEYLQADGWLEDSLVVVFSDHGQALGEHDYFGHHVYLDGFITDAVLMVRAPGMAPRRVPEVVSLLDIAPTVLEATGVAALGDLAGKSLLGPLDPHRLVVAEAFPARGNHLFQMANRRITDTAALSKRLRAVHLSHRSYEPKVSITGRDYRLIASRESGEAELYRRRAASDAPVVDKPDVESALLEALGAWHLETSEMIYCRVRNNQRRD